MSHFSIIMHYSQSFLPENQQQEVEEVRWKKVQENDAEIVHQYATADAAVRVPYRHLERGVVYGFASLFQHVLPRDTLSGRRCYVEHWNITGPGAETQPKL